MSPEENLKALGLELPDPPSPAGSYVPAVESQGFLFLSGLLPRRGTEIVFRGHAGADLSVEQAQEAARLCALNALSVLRQYLGSLDRVLAIVRVVGYVQTYPQFADHPRVLEGASRIFREVFGERGRHARSAVGAASLPGDAVCELELTAQFA